MILQSIRLRGFRGFRTGLGSEELFLDLAGLPDGLVAICGPNGAGKTTLLDNLHPYRIMPYKIRKSKEWSPAAFSFYDQCYGSDACKELIFEMGGTLYRSLILIDADRRKQEAYLSRCNNHALLGGVNDWYPINDGKVKTYDEAVESVCGSPSLFFTSVFRCQGAKNLSDYTRGDIMGIISELLNIDRIREQGDKCRAVVSGLSAGLSLTRDRVSVLQSEVDAATSVETVIGNATVARESAASCLAVAQSALVEASALTVYAKEQFAAQESEQARLAMIKTRLADEERQLVVASGAYNKIVADLDRRIVDVQADLSRGTADLSGRIARAEKVVSGADSIRAAISSELSVQQLLAQDRARMLTLQVGRDGAALALAQRHTAIVKIKTQVESCRKDAAKLDGLDCHGDASGWLNPTCRFISDAVVGRDALSGMVARLDELVANTEAADSVADFDTQLAACILSVESNTTALADAQRFTRLLPELELAETSLVGWRQELADLGLQCEVKLRYLSGDKWCADSEWDVARMALLDRIAGSKNEVSGFPAVNLVDVSSASIREGAARAAVEAYDKQVRESDLALAAMNVKLADARSKSEQIVVLRDKEIRLASEVSKFSLLMKACSNDGIIALELDDASPAITANVNDLLRACYGSRFTVRMDTQGSTVKGDVKETFDIVVFDADNSDERSITECSGGQVTILEDAITRGFCLYNIHGSGRVYGTLYSDEKDGALDEARKLEFMRVKREALRIGTHRHEFFITQTQDLVDMADARIVLGAGGATIQ